MKVLVTGSSGHLGEALMRLLPDAGFDPVGLDIAPGPMTTHVGSITDADLVATSLTGAAAILHTATLHKPHVATHSRQAFVDTNISGTLTLLDAALAAGIGTLIFTSTTSAFGSALTPPPGAPAAWIDGWVPASPKNIYGVTKTAAEDMCQLFHRRDGMNIVILRTSRFFPEPDDSPDIRAAYSDANAKANEFLFRRIDLHDAAMAHIHALRRAPDLGFARYVISATTPFARDHCADLRQDAPGVLRSVVPQYQDIYLAAGFRMFPGIDRVYDNACARRDLGWTPVYDFARILTQIVKGAPVGSPLSRQVGIKGYHGDRFDDGLYPVR